MDLTVETKRGILTRLMLVVTDDTATAASFIEAEVPMLLLLSLKRAKVAA